MKLNALSCFRPSIDRYGHVHLFERSVPPRLAAEVPMEERVQLRERFRRTVSAFRLRRNIASITGVAAVFLSWYALRRVPDGGDLFWIAAVVVVCITTGIANTMPRCPLCDSRLHGRLGHFCPNCGAAELAPGRLGVPYCSACRTYMTGMKGRRRYKIRACTWCGLMLDETGL